MNWPFSQSAKPQVLYHLEEPKNRAIIYGFYGEKVWIYINICRNERK